MTEERPKASSLAEIFRWLLKIWPFLPERRYKPHKRERGRRSGGEKRTRHTHNVHIADNELMTDRKPLAAHWFGRLNRGTSFSKFQVIYIRD